MPEKLTIGALAAMAGVTVRTLHHYDQIGLVSPDSRSDSGYRLYGREQVERLQEVLFFRELGFGLDDIKAMLAGHQRGEILQRQRKLLGAKAERALAMVDAVDRVIQSQKEGIAMSNEEILEIFDGFDPDEHETEAKERWGGSDAYQQSAQRTASYSKEDWVALKREADDINQSFLALMTDGTPANGAAAMDVAERHRTHISKWFYNCSKQIHSGLGQMYVSDVRFTESIDKTDTGLARYMSDAIAANSLR